MDYKPLNKLIEEEALKNYIEQFLTKYFGNGILDYYTQLEYINLAKDEILFYQGDPPTDMYILVSGKLQALLGKDLTEVGIINIGECVGETGLIMNNSRSTTVRACRDSLLIKITEAQFRDLYQKNPDLILNLSKTIIERLNIKNSGNPSHKDFCKVVSLVGLIPAVATLVMDHIQLYWNGFTNVISFEALPDTRDNLIEMSLKLYEAEQNHDLILLISGENERWNEWIMNNSDEIYFIGKEDSLDSLLRLNKLTHQSKKMILIYDPGEVPTHVSDWLPYFKASEIFKCKSYDTQHLERIARIVADKAICLTLGGGGALGFAHIGAMKALEEHGIPVDIIGGTSIGSMIGAMIALDHDVDEISRKARLDISEKNPLDDYTLPLIALLKGKRMQKTVDKYFSFKTENTWKNFLCIATNITHNRQEVIETGNLNQAIASSISIPGILPPVPVDNSFLVDGGVLNNLPVDEVRKAYKGYYITIDLNSENINEIELNYAISNKQVIKNIFNIDPKYIPTIMNVIMKCVSLSSVTKIAEMSNLSDLYINPKINYSFLNWKEMDGIAKCGYDEMNKAIVSQEIVEKIGIPIRKINN